MYHIDFNKPIHVHFIGIGGISMSGLAKILLNKHFTVSGSDNQKSDLTVELACDGCNIMYGQSSENITPDMDLVVYTAAIKDTNPELMRAKELNIPLLTRAELLGQIMTNYRTAINVAGTHGKTTTSSMVSEILLCAGCDPTISIGGILNSIKGNYRVGSSDIFVTEACEYTNSFLSFNPTVNIILNVQEDHLDFFKDIDDIRHSFRLFCEKLPKDGALIINSDIPDVAYFYKDLACQNIITFGSNPDTSDYSATDITYDSHGCCSYELIVKGQRQGTITLGVPGVHNVYNSLAAIAAGDLENISRDDIRRGLMNFTGAKRRFEVKGTLMPNNVTIVDDYAHHPVEIAATLNSAANYPHNNLWCVFQPHTYSRTKAFLKDFALSLNLADKVILADIYASRETDTLGISSQDLADELTALGCEVYYLPSFEKIEDFIRKNCINNDLLITMGAGDIVEVGNHLLSHN